MPANSIDLRDLALGLGAVINLAMLWYLAKSAPMHPGRVPAPRARDFDLRTHRGYNAYQQRIGQAWLWNRRFALPWLLFISLGGLRAVFVGGAKWIFVKLFGPVPTPVAVVVDLAPVVAAALVATLYARPFVRFIGKYLP